MSTFCDDFSAAEASYQPDADSSNFTPATINTDIDCGRGDEGEIKMTCHYVDRKEGKPQTFIIWLSPAEAQLLASQLLRHTKIMRAEREKTARKQEAAERRLARQRTRTATGAATNANP